MDNQRSKRVIIIGGGIGGLVTAIALQRIGMKTLVFERAHTLREVGAGIVLAGNAVKMLQKLGFGQTLATLGMPICHNYILSWHGDMLADTPVEPLMKKYQTQAFAVHRADLQSMLLDALDEGVLCTGAECTGFTQDETGVRAFFADGQQIAADMLIGADGLYSVVRENMFGSERPRYSGYTAWRGISYSLTSLYEANEHVTTELWGNGQRFGIVPLNRGRVYWWATVNMPEEAITQAAMSKHELLALYQGWHRSVSTLIAETDERMLLRTNIYDRNPLTHWSRGRVTLLGDAAHPMTPNLGQGACQAIEDAFALAVALRDSGGIDEALQQYERQRIKRANKMVRQSRRIGQVAQLPVPHMERIRNLLIKLTPSRLMQKQLEWALDHEI